MSFIRLLPHPMASHGFRIPWLTAIFDRSFMSPEEVPGWAGLFFLDSSPDDPALGAILAGGLSDPLSPGNARRVVLRLRPAAAVGGTERLLTLAAAEPLRRAFGGHAAWVLGCFVG
jgi:hypothetical protein